MFIYLSVFKRRHMLEILTYSFKDHIAVLQQGRHKGEKKENKAHCIKQHNNMQATIVKFIIVIFIVYHLTAYFVR